MMYFNPTNLSIIMLNVGGVSNPIKKQKLKS